MFLSEIFREFYIDNQGFALSKKNKHIDIVVTHEYLFAECERTQYGGKYDTDGNLSTVKNSTENDMWI